MINKSESSSKDADDREEEYTDLPQEIAGGFLTCSYTTPAESGFPPSQTHIPVGCGVKKENKKFISPYFSYKMKLISPAKKYEAIENLQAAESSQWHAYGKLPRTGKTKHLLGMVLIDSRSGKSHGPLTFPVSGLTPSSDAATLNLIDEIMPSGLMSLYDPVNDGDLQLPDFLKALSPNNRDTPILPASLCDNGVRRNRFDLSQFSDPIIQIGMLGAPIAERATGKQLLSNTDLDGKRKPTKNVSCFHMAKQAAPESYTNSINQDYVIEGEGCLFLQSKDGYIIFDRNDLEKYNIKRPFLETYVKARMCSGG
jgi:hypothetical protein